MGLRTFIKRTVLGRPEAAPTARPAPAVRLPDQADARGFRAVATPDRVADGTGSTFRVDGVNVAVFRVGGRLYATADACRHEDGPLGEGALDGPVVTCPYHDWKYDVTTGDCLTDPTRPLPCYTVEERGGFIWVGARMREGSADRGGEHDDGLETIIVEPAR